MDLKFTASAIRKLEKETKKPLGDLVSATDLESLNVLVRTGLGVNEDEADAQIDAFLATGKDTTELLVFILKTLEDQGFLYRKLKISQRVVEGLDKKIVEMEKALSEKTDSNTSQITG